MSLPLRFEGITLTVQNVRKSVEFYRHLGFHLEVNAAPNFALLRLGDSTTVPSLSFLSAEFAEKTESHCLRETTTTCRIELTAENLDKLYSDFLDRKVKIKHPPQRGCLGKVHVGLRPRRLHD